MTRDHKTDDDGNETNVKKKKEKHTEDERRINVYI